MRRLDFSQPVAVLLIAVLHIIPDLESFCAVVRRLIDALPSGCCPMIGHGASDVEPEAAPELSKRDGNVPPTKIRLRSREEILTFFDGLELIGRVPLSHWWWYSASASSLSPTASPAAAAA